MNSILVVALPNHPYSPLKKAEAVCYSYFIAAELWFCKRLCNDGNMSKHIAYPVFYSVAMHRTSRKLNYPDNSQTLQKFHTLTRYPVVHCRQWGLAGVAFEKIEMPYGQIVFTVEGLVDGAQFDPLSQKLWKVLSSSVNFPLSK